MYNYVVTPQKSTIVTQAILANFTSSTDVNLILEKGSRLEVHLLTQSGLRTLIDVDLFSQIKTLSVFRPQDLQKDLLLVSTQKFKYAILEYNSSTREIITRKSGSFSIPNEYSVNEHGPKVAISPNLQLIAYHVYCGTVRIISYDEKGEFKEETDYQYEDSIVSELHFLEGSQNPTLIFAAEHKKKRYVRVYEINPSDKTLVSANWEIPTYETSVDKIITLPAPLGGAVLLGPRFITYFDKTTNKTLATTTDNIVAYGKIDKDGSRYLVADRDKKLYILILKKSENKVVDLALVLLGETNIASSIVYLDSSYVFIGSQFADSQLIALKTEPNEEGSFVEIRETFLNLGPICDFVLVDLDKKGLNQVVTCSGYGKDGSLRVVKTGIGSIEQASVELSGVRGLWSLKSSQDDVYDKYLVVSFVGQTRLLTGDAETLGEALIEGFLNDQQTLYCANVNHNQLLQITSYSIRLIDATTHKLSKEFIPEGTILVASSTKSQVVAALGGGFILYLQIDNKDLTLVSQTKAEHEVACITINSFGQPQADFCVIGLWTDISLRILALPSLNLILTESINGEVVPRSLLLTSFEDNYLLCGLADGRLLYYIIDLTTKALSDKKRMTFGTQPISLTQFWNNNSNHVFVGSDRPTILHSQNKKLNIASVNLKKVNYMTPFHTENLRDSITWTTDTSLTIGNIDNIQKLYIKTIPLGEMPRRIVYVDSAQVFAVLTIAMVQTDNSYQQVSKVILVDQSFEVIHEFELHPDEKPLSLNVCTFDGYTTEFVVVGTAIEPPNVESDSGNLHLFEIESQNNKKQLHLVTTTLVKGPIFHLAPFRQNLLISFMNRLQYFTLTEGKEKENEGKLQLVASETCCNLRPENILIVKFITRGSSVIVADAMQSISCMSVDPFDLSIEVSAKHYSENWMVEIQSLQDNLFIGAEHNHNLFVVRYNSAALDPEVRERLEEVGCFHVGEQITRFQLGSLVFKDPDSEYKDLNSLIYVTNSGSIGIVAAISEEDFNFFEKLQSNLQKVLVGVGGFSHQDWRAFQTERRQTPSKNFIDGDLIETYLELSTASMEKIAHDLNTTTSEISKRIKSLSRALH